MEKKDQLCWSCKNACGGCEWSARLEPVAGWTAKKVKRKGCNSSQAIGDPGKERVTKSGKKIYCYEYETYEITACPKFERG